MPFYVEKERKRMEEKDIFIQDNYVL